MRRRLTVTGRVQGVGYRDWFVRRARELDLTGWVRNRTDGSVEALVDGTPDHLDAIIAAAHRGPPAARVADVSASNDHATDPLPPFERRPTA